MTAQSPSKGGFFAIDSRIWAKLTVFGMTEAVAYLVLACGTGYDNRSTKWSITAAKKYAGLSWERATKAIRRLIDNGFIRCAESHTHLRPRYELATHRELVEYEAAKNLANLDCSDRKLLADLREGKQPTRGIGRRVAERLRERKFLRRSAEGTYEFPETVTEDSGDDSIWLPNTIVMGTLHGEESPVRRLRSAGDVWTLRVFVDFYSVHNLRDDGGVSPSVIRQSFERQKIGQQGPYTIWGFKPKEFTHSWSGPFGAHQSRQKEDPLDESPTWRSINLLMQMGLLSFVPHIFESDSAEAEPIHAYGIGGKGEDPIEEKIGYAADLAARAMALPNKLREAEMSGFEYFCPALSTNPTVQMIGVARLTYRPHTRRTAAWSAELHQTAQGWIDTFDKLAEKAQQLCYSQHMG